MLAMLEVLLLKPLDSEIHYNIEIIYSIQNVFVICTLNNFISNNTNITMNFSSYFFFVPSKLLA